MQKANDENRFVKTEWDDLHSPSSLELHGCWLPDTWSVWNFNVRVACVLTVSKPRENTAHGWLCEKKHAS